MKTHQTQENKKDLLILVDESDEELGFKSKSECHQGNGCLLYTSPSPRDRSVSRMPSSA